MEVGDLCFKLGNAAPEVRQLCGGAGRRMVEPCIEFFGVSDDGTTKTFVWATNRQT